MRRNEADQMVAHDGERLFCFWVTQEPLLADPWLYRHVAALAEADIVLIRLSFR